MLTTTDIAERLNVSEKTVRNWIEDGQLEGYKLGKNYRVEPEALERFLESNKISNNKEIESNE